MHEVFSAYWYILFARASCGAISSLVQDLSDCSVFRLRCRASDAHLIESPLGIKIGGFKQLVPKKVCLVEKNKICLLMVCFSSSLRRVLSLLVRDNEMVFWRDIE